MRLSRKFKKKLGARSAREISRKLGARRPKVGLLRGRAALGGAQNHHSEFPTWAKAARMVFSFTPSSAASERVFSLLKQLFGDQQLSSLMDYIQGSIMLNYNDRAL